MHSTYSDTKNVTIAIERRDAGVMVLISIIMMMMMMMMMMMNITSRTVIEEIVSVKLFAFLKQGCR